MTKQDLICAAENLLANLEQQGVAEAGEHTTEIEQSAERLRRLLAPIHTDPAACSDCGSHEIAELRWIEMRNGYATPYLAITCTMGNLHTIWCPKCGKLSDDFCLRRAGGTCMKHSRSVGRACTPLPLPIAERAAYDEKLAALAQAESVLNTAIAEAQALLAKTKGEKHG